MFSAFPKIFHLGTVYVDRLFEGAVEVTEKIDGSQFSAGKVGGELLMRSKGVPIFDPDKMFRPVVDHINFRKQSFPEGIAFYGETLCKPKHNILTYDRVPKGHWCLFGAVDLKSMKPLPYRQLAKYATQFEVDVVPRLGGTHINVDPSTLQEELDKWLETESYLGGQKIEGVVIKNYNEQLIIGGTVLPILCAKFVSERFKEKHAKDWSVENTSGGKMGVLKEKYKSEVRWEKALQHLRDDGIITSEPKDIGALIKEVKRDIVEEEKQEIMEALWKIHSGDILKVSTAGLPEWYKRRLVGGVDDAT